MKNTRVKNIFFGFAILVLAGCQDDSRLTEVKNQELSAEQQFKRTLSNEMETDLSRRQRFYQSVSGVYEGVVQTQNGSFNIRIRLVSSLPPYQQTRIRMQEEVAADLNNLYLNAQIIQWNTGTNVGAVGCRMSEIRADIDQGQITIASPDCPNFYQIKINEESLSGGRVDQSINDESASRRVAQSILEGHAKKIKFLDGVIQPSSSSEQYKFQVERVGK
jgi:hypothetical protein